MLPYGSLEVKTTATLTRGYLRVERGQFITSEVEQQLLDNLVTRLDQSIKRITSLDLMERSLALPENYSSIKLEAHESACHIKWTDWYRDANDFAKLSLLVDWRRAALEQKERTVSRPETRIHLSQSALEAKRRADRKRKQRSRDRKKEAAKAAGTWRPRGRPKSGHG